MLNYDIDKRPSASDSFDELEIIELFIKSPKNKIIKKVLRELKMNENKENENNHIFKRHNSVHITPHHNFNFNQTFQNHTMIYQGYFNNMSMNNQIYFQNNCTNMNQINTNMISSQNNLVNKNEGIYKDIYPEIKEKKINVKFIFPKKNIYIKIPSSLRKDELYSTVNYMNYIYNIRLDFPSNDIIEMIELFHNGIELENDDSPINFIKDFDSIIVKINEPEIELYNESINLKTRNSEKINIYIDSVNDVYLKSRIGLILGENMTFEEMMKLLCLRINIKFHYNDNINIINNTQIIYNKELKSYNKTLFKNEIINGNHLIIEYSVLESKSDDYSIIKNPGKHLHVSVKDEIDNLKFNFHAGTLQKIKDFYKYLNLYLIEKKGIKENENLIIYIGNIELKKDNERTFNSLGIRNDFTCIIKVIKKDL